VVVIFKVFFLKKVFDVVEAAGEEVVHTNDLIPFFKETVG